MQEIAKSKTAPVVKALTLPAARLVIAISLLLWLSGCNSSGSSSTGDASAFVALNSGAALAAPAHWTIEQQTVLRSGEPLFPIGIYYVAHQENQKARRLQDLPVIKAAGFDFIHTPINTADGPLLDLAADLGLQVVVEFNQEPLLVLEQFANHPALSFLGTFDDVDSFRRDGELIYDPAFVEQQSASLKAAAGTDQFTPLTFISGGYPDKGPLFADSADILAQQAYPVDTAPLRQVLDSYLPVEQSMSSGNRAFFAVLQSFAWGVRGDRFLRAPTAAEVRNMTYQALIAGARGIFYYTYLDPVFDLSAAEHAGLWQGLTEVVGELKQLTPMLLHGRPQWLTRDDRGVFAAYWQPTAATDALLIAVNTTNAPRAVSYPLPAALLNREATALFSGAAAGLAIGQGSLSGTIPSEAVALHHFASSTGAAGNLL